MHKKCLNKFHQEEYETFKTVALQFNLATCEHEDWGDTPTFCGLSTEGPHMRPTRRGIYNVIETIAHVLDALLGQYDKALPYLQDFVGQEWPDIDSPLPGNDITGDRKN